MNLACGGYIRIGANVMSTCFTFDSAGGGYDVDTGSGIITIDVQPDTTYNCSPTAVSITGCCPVYRITRTC